EQLAVDPALQLDRVPVGVLVGGDQDRAERRESGERLAQAELRLRPAGQLDGARGEVLGGGDARHVVPSDVCGDAVRLATDHHGYLDLPVDLVGRKLQVAVGCG